MQGESSFKRGKPNWRNWRLRTRNWKQRTVMQGEFIQARKHRQQKLETKDRDAMREFIQARKHRQQKLETKDRDIRHFLHGPSA